MAIAIRFAKKAQPPFPPPPPSLPRREHRGLMSILSRVIKRETKHFHENGIRLLHIGRLNALDPRLQRQVLDAVELTKRKESMTVRIAFNFAWPSANAV